MTGHSTVGRRAAGRNAAVLKYDILTALGTHGCAGDKNQQRLVLRLITLIVARYNWITDEIAVGQREMAELWSIDERSVKREVARMRELGWLVVKRAPARGRVAVHGLGLERILGATEKVWSRVGSDFVARMTPAEPAQSPARSNVIRFPAPSGEGLWDRMQALLQREDPNLHALWFAALCAEEPEPGVLRLSAPTRFHADYLRINLRPRLEAAGRPDLRRLDIEGPG